LNSLTVC